MNVVDMRLALQKKYNQKFTEKMSDAQVIAVYRRLQSKNQI